MPDTPDANDGITPTSAETNVPNLSDDGDGLQSELLDDLALEDTDDELAADEELSILDEAGEGDLADETDDEE